MLFTKLSILIVITLLNGYCWFRVGQWVAYVHSKCYSNDKYSQHCSTKDRICGTRIDAELPRLRPLLTRGFVRYKADALVNIRYPEWSILMQPKHTQKCDKIVNPHASRKRKKSCLAVVTVNSEYTYNLLRFDSVRQDADEIPHGDTALLNNTGFFNNVANENGRSKLSSKMLQLFGGLSSLENYIFGKLHSRSLYPGDDVVVMVLNAGEVDLFANFACSCHAHNISMENVLVFAGSNEVVDLIESMGAMALYHAETFAPVSRNASYEYLDHIFIDMMWYKSFSVWLLLKMRYNVLFQDVDLVWFRNPVNYFRKAAGIDAKLQDSSNNYWGNKDITTTLKKEVYSVLGSISDHIPKRYSYSDAVYHRRLSNSHSIINSPSNTDEYLSSKHQQIIQSVHHDSWGNRLLTLPPADAYLSDDGQRSIRYTPFFANSGFYYLVANHRTEYFAWTVMTAFDLLHITGSHQNIFTIRLIETLDLGRLRPKLLSLREFPSGVKYNHDKPYMRAIRDGHEHPFVFHMCWTRNKYDKLRNFRLVSMWFLNELDSTQLEELGKLRGEMGAQELRSKAARFAKENIPIQERWKIMSSRLCVKP